MFVHFLKRFQLVGEFHVFAFEFLGGKELGAVEGFGLVAVVALFC